MEAFPTIALLTADSVLASAIPAQLKHRYGQTPQPVVSLADLDATPAAVAIIDCRDGLPALHSLRGHHPQLALALIAAGDGQEESDATADLPLVYIIPRPVHMPQLIRRLEQLRGRLGSQNQQQELALSRDILFRPIEKTLLFKGHTLEITDKESALLQCLHQNRESWITRETLLEEVWGYAGSIDTHTLETHLYRLRAKLRGLLGDAELIQTRQGGYRLNPEPL